MPATNLGVFVGAGLRNVQIGARNANGIFTGFGALTSTNTGMMSAMRRIVGGVTAGSPLPGVERVYSRDADRQRYKFLWQGQPTDFSLTLESSDIEAMAFLKKSALFVVGDSDVLNAGGSSPLLQDTVLLLTRHAQSAEPATDAAPVFEHWVYLSCNFQPGADQMEYQAIGQTTLEGAASPVTTSPWGASLLTLAGENDGMIWKFSTEHPLTFFAWVSDGTATAVPLPYAPIDAAHTLLYNTATGAPITVSAVSPTGKTATIAAAPASGTIVFGWLETKDL